LVVTCGRYGVDRADEQPVSPTQPSPGHPSPAQAQHALRIVIVAAVAGGLIGIIDNDAQSGVEYGLVVAAVLVGLVLFRRQAKR
jgi:hypothetical protein